MPRQAVIVFARYPEPGAVKSRLARGVGAAKASEIYEQLLRYAFGVLDDFQRLCPQTTIEVSLATADRVHDFRRRFAVPWPVVPQGEGHLGKRMAEAFERLFARGFSRVVLMGSDVCDMCAQDLSAAFRLLQSHEAVLGPARDGGFYAIGLRRPCPEIFSFSTWGSADVFQRTQHTLSRLGLSLAVLPLRTDIDRPEDLRLLERHWAFRNSLAVVVPTIGGLQSLTPWLEDLRRILWPGDTVCIVQGTTALASQEPIRTGDVIRVQSPLGRGLQLNAGARACPGEVLWFLHHDCSPGFCAAYHVRQICRDPGAALGVFRLGFSPTNRALRAVARWANWRTSLFRLPYGDQGFFCRRETFDAVGGFRAPYIMEDVDFVRACRRLGRLWVAPDVLLTSPRRYLSQGIFKTSLRNHITLFGHFLGVSNAVLYRRYYGLSHGPLGGTHALRQAHANHEIFHS
ncbi:TIGR04282 family arsenosugar biosynthesis glycosyltransferase [Desulfosoma caldarium]|uniref:RSAM/selenodomain-associated transferase 1 n=1 Tax=Desulfosoma caldarium TaxID=610254 RepID=A0A3N1UY09_9BACT|nr:TIGR04282 family arsenosugar biosynthesis glycosyltransferase [Desulfosoma caldarium]ROQ93427.1 rSAM/selenodomain-associated transferase 1 [Desulfosoma caldarium]